MCALPLCTVQGVTSLAKKLCLVYVVRRRNALPRPGFTSVSPKTQGAARKCADQATTCTQIKIYMQPETILGKYTHTSWLIYIYAIY